MEKKLTNSGPLMEPADKHSIYTMDKTANAKGMLCDGWLTQYRVSLDLE
jgi:hypothetical protein